MRTGPTAKNLSGGIVSFLERGRSGVLAGRGAGLIVMQRGGVQSYETIR